MLLTTISSPALPAAPAVLKSLGRETEPEFSAGGSTKCHPGREAQENGPPGKKPRPFPHSSLMYRP